MTGSSPYLVTVTVKDADGAIVGTAVHKMPWREGQFAEAAYREPDLCVAAMNVARVAMEAALEEEERRKIAAEYAE